MPELWEIELDKYIDDTLWSGWNESSANVRNKAHKLVKKWAIGNREELANAIAASLEDGSVDQKEILRLLALLVEAFGSKDILGNGILANLLDRLKSSGTLTTRDLAEVTAGWAATRTNNVELRNLLAAVTSGHSLNTQTILNELIAWVGRQGGPELAQLLRDQLDDENSPITARYLLPLVAGYFVRKGLIKNPGGTITTWQQALIATLHTLDDSPLIDVLKALLDEDEVQAAKLLILYLGITSDELLIQSLLTGQFEALILRELSEAVTKYINGITSEQATALAQAMFDIFSKKRELIASETERIELARIGEPMTQEVYDSIWLPTRKILYAAQIACAGGALVPTEAMARPHVFAAAAIQAKTPVKSLASPDQRALLAECIKLFTREEFRDAPNGEHWGTDTPASFAQINSDPFRMIEVFTIIRVVIQG